MNIWSNLSVKFLLYYGLVLCLFTLVECNCPSQKMTRRNQKSRLETLSTTDVVVEALYQGTTRGYHKFHIEQVWKQNNGNLHSGEGIFIDTTIEASYEECFRRLFLDESYLLMIAPHDRTNKIFQSLEAPAFSYHKKLRRAIFSKLCAPPGKSSSSCEMKITLPEKLVYYQDQRQSIICKVDSFTPVTQVEWYKDGTALSNGAGITLNTNEKDHSVLLFSGVSNMHEGIYRCSAANEGGQRVSAEVGVEVEGPLSLSHFEECDQPHFCMNGGKCRQMFDGHKSCECTKLYRGNRCDEPLLDISPNSKPEVVIRGDTEELKTSVSHLTTALTAVSITLFFVVILSLTYIIRIKKKLSPDPEVYDEGEKISMHRLPQDGANTPLNLGSLLLEEATTPVRIFIEDSQHSFEILPSPAPSRKGRSTSDQYLSVYQPNITPRTPKRHMKSFSDKPSFSTPVSPCPSPGSPYDYAKRGRLQGRSFS